MSPAEKIVFNTLAQIPGSTALEIWVAIKSCLETDDDKRLVKSLFPNEDQTVREVLALLEKAKKVKHSIKASSILKEWAVV